MPKQTTTVHLPLSYTHPLFNHTYLRIHVASNWYPDHNDDVELLTQNQQTCKPYFIRLTR